MSNNEIYDKSPRSVDSRSPLSNHHSRSRSRSITPAKRSRTRSVSYEKTESRRRSHRSRTPKGRDSYSRSRSRSRSRKRHRSRSRSRSPYRSRSDRRSYRSHSRSPRRRNSTRRDDYGGGGRVARENPKTSKCLGVFGLSLHTESREVRDMFAHYGPVDDVQVVYDHQTGRSRGFAFVYMHNLDDAVEAKERIPGQELDGRRLRVDYSITNRPHTPTPGVYLGRSSDRSGGRHYRRSPSPYYSRSRRRSRSRSRSYSPREYRRSYSPRDRRSYSPRYREEWADY